MIECVFDHKYGGYGFAYRLRLRANCFSEWDVPRAIFSGISGSW